MPKVSMERIVEATLKGVFAAWKKHYEINRGSKIFESLGREGLWVSLEEPMRNIIDYSNSRRPGRYPQRLSGKKKSDISVWWADGTLRGIVEVKVLRNADISLVRKDVDRICELLRLKDDSTVQFGILTAYADRYDEEGTSRKQVIEVLDRVDALVREVAEEKLDSPSFISKFIVKTVREDRSSWGAISCLIKR